MNFHGPLKTKANEAIFDNLKGLSMSVVYDNNVLNPIRGQQAGASHRWLCCLDSAGSLPQLDIYVSMTTDMEDRVYSMS